ncbi:MAG: mannose-1-phosphate guanylyltransferase [Rikenellaceae bacterium]|nr:mannose-1-phosphate guanylyltransferase [Rikenellaceae bacterium]
MNQNNYCIIMAGGVGSRFWPVSRKNNPKQFLDILGTGKSFIRHTYERFTEIIPPENFYVVTNKIYKQLVKEHIPELNDTQILSEPLGRNTAPCIAYAAYKINKLNPDASMVVAPSDHLVLNEPEFRHVIAEGFDFARSNEVLVTIGIKPNRPDTGYGYIQIDSSVKTGDFHKVKTFTEKPTLEVAKMFIDSGEFFWNSGIFIWRTSEIIKQFRSHLTEVHTRFDSITESYNTDGEEESINKIYPECRNISIDYGIMEKADNVYVRCSEFGWSDIGTWGSIYQHSVKDDNGNAVTGDVLEYDTEGCIINMPKGKIAVIQGMKDFIIVDSSDALLICPKDDEQNIRMYIEEVKMKKGPDYI